MLGSLGRFGTLSGVVAITLAAAAARLQAADSPPAASPADQAAPISFFRDIRPILQANCQGCHQPAKAQGQLVLTSHASLLKAGESGEAAVVPGKPEASHLLAQVTPKDGKAEMPKDKDPLSADQIDKLRRWIAAGASDDTPASVGTLIDAAHPPVYAAPPVITSLDYSPDDSLLAVSGYHEVLLYKADGSELVGRLVGEAERIESAAFSPDGKSLAVAGGSPGRMGELQVWDVAERKLRYSIPVTYDTLYGASWIGDGSKIAFGCADNTVRAIDAATGKQVLFQGAHSDWVLDTVFSKDGAYVISVSRDRSMKLIELATQRFIDNITSITPGALKGGLAAVDRNPKNDELLIGGADGVPKIYQMFRTKARVIGDDYNMIKAFDAVPGRIYDVQYSPDGSQFVVGSSLDGTGEVRVYDVASGKVLQKIEGQGPVYSVTYSADGKRIASGGFDGLVRIHDAADGHLIKEFTAAPITPAAKVAGTAAP